MNEYLDDWNAYSDNPPNLIDDSSMFYFKGYEILFCTGIGHSFDDSPSNVIQILNGANVINPPNTELKYKINWLEKGKAIKSISFFTPPNKKYLGDVFTEAPYGLIKKNRTGIGATTLELNSDRNSIVVVPTKALAYEKARSSWDSNINKYKICYVGSPIPGFKTPAVQTYLADEEIRYKKFIVVADSLPRLLNQLGETCYQDYFLMVDEIDSYQYDNSYRPALEDVIDCYFQFPQTCRCLVSATVSDFSNPQINEEPVIEVLFNDLETRNIHLLHTKNIYETAKQHIELILQNHPNDKILIAYNTVSGILTLINSLNESLREKCTILCSTKNKNTIKEYYNELINTTLPKQINFMTCIYFVGVDINEPFHLISIADIRKTHTLLSEDKLQQIAGRCRIPNGILSETVIYNSGESIDIDIENTRQQAIEAATLLANYADIVPEVKKQFPRIINRDNDIDEAAQKNIITKSTKQYYMVTTAPLVRIDINIHICPCFFNIYNLLIQLKLRKILYASPKALPQTLREQKHEIVFEEAEVSNAENYQEIEQSVEEEIQQNIEEERENITQQLREYERIGSETHTEANDIEERKKLAEKIMYSSGCCTQNRIFLERFVELQEYIPFEILIEKLKEYDTPSEYQKFYNATVFWSLDEEHPLKKLIYQCFPINEEFTGNELTEKFNNIWTSMFRGEELSNRQAIPKLKVFCKLKRTSQRINRNPRPTYKIINYDYFELQCEPIKRRESNTDVTQKFRFES